MNTITTDNKDAENNVRIIIITFFFVLLVLLLLLQPDDDDNSGDEYSHSNEFMTIEDDDDDDNEDDDNDANDANDAVGDDVDDDDLAEMSSGWGHKKKTYYGADTGDFEYEEDDELAKEEENELRRMNAEQAKKYDEVDLENPMLQALINKKEKTDPTSLASDNKKKKKKSSLSGETDEDILQSMNADLDEIDMKFDDFNAIEVNDFAHITLPNSSSSSSSSTLVPSAASTSTERIIKDFSELSSHDKYRELKKNSPELFGLIAEFKSAVDVFNHQIQPAVHLIRPNLLTHSNLQNNPFVQNLFLQFHIYLTYLTNIAFYFAIKTEPDRLHTAPSSSSSPSSSSGPSVSSRSLSHHPILSTLTELKYLIDEMKKNDELSQLNISQKELQHIIQQEIKKQQTTQQEKTRKQVGEASSSSSSSLSSSLSSSSNKSTKSKSKLRSDLTGLQSMLASFSSASASHLSSSLSSSSSLPSNPIDISKLVKKSGKAEIASARPSASSSSLAFNSLEDVNDYTDRYDVGSSYHSGSVGSVGLPTKHEKMKLLHEKVLEKLQKRNPKKRTIPHFLTFCCRR